MTAARSGSPPGAGGPFDRASGTASTGGPSPEDASPGDHPGGEDAQLEQLAWELATLAERLTEVAMERLRSAADGGEAELQAAIETERRLNRARRSVEKAAVLLVPRAPGDLR